MVRYNLTWYNITYNLYEIQRPDEKTERENCSRKYKDTLL